MNRRIGLVKFGGGLITDKSAIETPRLELIRDLACVFAENREAGDCSWILSHGSGSFGHQAAQGSVLADTVPSSARGVALDAGDRLAVARTADAAARLHRLVLAALLEFDVPCFSWLASSVASGLEQPDEVSLDALRGLLAEGMVPVTMGDVVVAGLGGTRIWSTEKILSTIAQGLGSDGWRVERALWFGNTDGILGADGAVIDRIAPGDLEDVRRLVSGSEGVDVTGGMRLRLETCAALGALGVESWVLDGRDLEVVAAAFRGSRLGGTRFVGATLDHRIHSGDLSV